MSENNFTSYIALGVCKDCRKKKMCPASSRGVQCNEFKPFTNGRSAENGKRIVPERSGTNKNG